MKKIPQILTVFLSVLCLMLTFVCFSNSMVVKAAGDVSSIFSIETEGFNCDGTVTYTVSIKENISFYGCILNFEYVDTVASVIDAGAFTTLNSYGNTDFNIYGMYEFGQKNNSANTYIAAFLFF